MVPAPLVVARTRPAFRRSSPGDGHTPTVTIDRDQAFALLVDSCPSFRAVGGFEHYVSVFEDPGEPDAFVRVGALAHHVVELVDRRDVEELGWLLDTVERVLAEGDADAVELVTLGFLEPLRNIVSHEDVGASAAELATVLGPDAAVVWRENEELWESAARWRPAGSAVGAADYAGVTSPDLRRYLQAHKRRMADGVLLGASDVVNYQQEVRAISPVFPAGRPKVRWPVVLAGVVLVALAVLLLLR